MSRESFKNTEIALIWKPIIKIIGGYNNLTSKVCYDYWHDFFDYKNCDIVCKNNDDKVIIRKYPKNKWSNYPYRTDGLVIAEAHDLNNNEMCWSSIDNVFPVETAKKMKKLMKQQFIEITRESVTLNTLLDSSEKIKKELKYSDDDSFIKNINKLLDTASKYESLLNPSKELI